jgi:hypothetical protein
MDNTHDFVEKIHEKQEKDAKNKKLHGHGNPGKKKPNKEHK